MARPTYDELLGIIAEKDRQIALLDARVTELERQLEKATRSGKRQAAPFSKGPPRPNPKKPGRKSGNDYGEQANRRPPEEPPDEIIDVPGPRQCADCGGVVDEICLAEQYQVEVPRKPIVRRFDIHLGRCRRCGRRIQPRHALQTSDALGGAAVQFGPDLQAFMALMKNVCGLSYGRISSLLKDGFGIRACRGAVARTVLRVAGRAGPVYAAIGEAVRHSDLVYPDETGWKVGGRLQWLWVFVTREATLYVIRPSRGSDVLAEVLGTDFGGRLVHDGWAPYDLLADATHQQCLAHLLRRAVELEEVGQRGAVRFPRAVEDLLLEAIGLRARQELEEITPHGFTVLRGRLEKRLDRLLDCRLSHRGNRRFQKHLAGHRDQLFTFLYDAELEPCNWPAEQAIRPAVVNRKVFGGNRTPRGARAQGILSSVFATCNQQAHNAMTFLSNLIRTPTSLRRAFPQQIVPARAPG